MVLVSANHKHSLYCADTVAVKSVSIDSVDSINRMYYLLDI